jgi:type IV fimbrial biogenesis protein FimT
MHISKGFSLIELMVVLSVAAVLLGIGVPGFRSLIQGQRMTTTVNDLFASINLARSEAMQRGARVDLVPADADGKDWSKGWIVFVDTNSDQIADAGEQVIFSHGPVPDGIAIDSAFTDPASRLYISYNGTGRTRTNASSQSPQLGTISFVQDAQVKRIKINFLGRPRVCDPAREPTTCTRTADTK